MKTIEIPVTKKLKKRYKNLKQDLNLLLDNFETIHLQTIIIRKNIYKVRLANSDKNSTDMFFCKAIVDLNSGK